MSKNFLSNKQTSIKTSHNKKKVDVKGLFFTSIIIVFICALVISPDRYIEVAFNGILVWGTIILPALFPFMIFTKLLTSTGYIESFSKGLSPFTKKLYKAPGISSYIFLMSIISGYPLGAKITSDLYEEGLINREEAHRICSFTSNSGPMFIVGTVGVGMLVSPVAGYIILASHIISALLNGLIYRNYAPKNINLKKVGNTKKDFVSEKDILTRSMEDSIISMLKMGGYIAVFFVITEILSSLCIINPIINLFNFLGVDTIISKGVFFGFFEITKGCLYISSSSIPMYLKIIFSSFIISFGGLAVMFQSFSFLDKLKISKTFFLLQKITHAILSFIISIILLLIFPL